MRNALKHFCETFLGGFGYLGRVYARGLSVIFRALAASLIISLFTMPLRLLDKGFERTVDRFLPSAKEDPMTLVVYLGLAGLICLIYYPPVIYVAASWVGFCKRVEDPYENEGDEEPRLEKAELHT